MRMHHACMWLTKKCSSLARLRTFAALFGALRPDVERLSWDRLIQRTLRRVCAIMHRRTCWLASTLVKPVCTVLRLACLHYAYEMQQVRRHAACKVRCQRD
jgi:hypothetical protein